MSIFTKAKLVALARGSFDTYKVILLHYDGQIDGKISAKVSANLVNTEGDVFVKVSGERVYANEAVFAADLNSQAGAVAAVQTQNLALDILKTEGFADL